MNKDRIQNLRNALVGNDEPASAYSAYMSDDLEITPRRIKVADVGGLGRVIPVYEVMRMLGDLELQVKNPESLAVIRLLRIALQEATR